MINFFKQDFFIKYKLKLFLILFIILNSIKLVCFNFYLSQNIQNLPLFFLIKFGANVILVSAIFLTLFKHNLKKSAITFYVLQFIYILAHICYFKYFNNYLHLVQSILLLGEGTKALAHLYFFMDFSIIMLFIDMPLFIYLVKNIKSENDLKISFSNYVFIGLSMCLVAYSCFYIVSFINMSNPKKATPLTVTPSESYIVRKNGTLVNEIISLATNLNDEKIILGFKYGKKINRSENTGNNPNIVILQLESIDSNVVNKKYNGKYIAPFLHSLATNSVYYPYTMSYHMGGGTSDSEFSIINSIEPSQSYPAMKLRTYTYPNSLVKQFRNNNYDCFAFHGNAGNYFNRDDAFSLMGFSKYYDIVKMFLKHVGWGAPDKDVLDFATDKILKNKKPTFSYIITMTSHASFKSVYNYYTNHDYDNINDEVVKNYFNSVSYVDKTLEEFVTNIREQNPNTYVLIWGDHTPAINKPDYSQASLSYDGKYFEFIPLFILTPDNLVYRENSRVASFLDIAPTILELSGIKYNYKTDGDNLLDFDNHDSKIPFKGNYYSKSDLFNLISNAGK